MCEFKDGRAPISTSVALNELILMAGSIRFGVQAPHCESSKSSILRGACPLLHMALSIVMPRRSQASPPSRWITKADVTLEKKSATAFAITSVASDIDGKRYLWVPTRRNSTAGGMAKAGCPCSKLFEYQSHAGCDAVRLLSRSGKWVRFFTLDKAKLLRGDHAQTKR